MLDTSLKACGLNNSEQKVLLALLKQSPCLASSISKRTGLKRPTVYAVLDSLVEMGLVVKKRHRNATQYTPIPLDTIPQLLENRARRAFNQVQQAVEQIKPALEQFQQQEKVELAGFEISSVESLDAMYLQLEGALLSGDFDAIFNPQMSFALPNMDEVIMKFLKETAQTKSHIREIAVEGPLTEWYQSHIKNPNHQLKIIDSSEHIYSDMIFVNDKVVLIQYDPEHEVGIEIRQKEYYESMKTVFEMLWKRL
jgi:DNA-binding MarR family transcriptional regulator